MDAWQSRPVLRFENQRSHPPPKAVQEPTARRLHRSNPSHCDLSLCSTQGIRPPAQKSPTPLHLHPPVPSPAPRPSPHEPGHPPPASAAMGAQQSVNAGKGQCPLPPLPSSIPRPLRLVGAALVVKLSLSVWLTCLWKCRSQGGCARRPHPHALRGAPAPAPEVLGRLPRSFPTDWDLTRADSLCVCVCVCFFQELQRHHLADRRKVGVFVVLIPSVNFMCPRGMCASLPVSVCAGGHLCV